MSVNTQHKMDFLTEEIEQRIGDPTYLEFRKKIWITSGHFNTSVDKFVWSDNTGMYGSNIENINPLHKMQH